MFRSVAVAGLVLLAMTFFGCSKGSAPDASTKSEPGKAEQAQAKPAESVDEAIPPILRTPWKGDLDEIATRRVVRVLVPFRRPEFFYIDGQPAGILFEAFQDLERVINTTYKTKPGNHIVVVLVPTPLDKLRQRFVEGYGDIAAYSISITDDNKALVDFTKPTITGIKIVPVTGPGAPDLKSIEDLSGKEVWVHYQSRLKKDIEVLNAKLQAQGKSPAVAREIDPLLEPGDVMEMVNAGTYPISLMQSVTAEFWAKVFDKTKVRTDLAVAEDIDLGWAIQKGTPKLKSFLDEFLTTHAAGTSFGNTVMQRYLKGAKYVRNATDPSELTNFRKTLPYFQKYGEQYKFDTLLLVAQGYQESRLDQKVKSQVGAVGIMQVMPTTAAADPVNIKKIDNEENNIHAGVRLIHFLVNDYFKEPEIDQFNRTLFGIAAYNAGPAKITKCRDLATKMGYDRNKWFGNVEVATAKLVGRETTQYVANVYKYYLAYRMAQETGVRRKAAVKRAHDAKVK